MGLKDIFSGAANSDAAGVINDYAGIYEKLDKEMRGLGKMNLIVAGKTGAGKSLLINAVFRENLAPTGSGRPVTHEIKAYESEEVPMRIFDTVGLELANRDDVMKDIESLMDGSHPEAREMRENHEAIHMIWYCINAGSHRAEDSELDLIRNICRWSKYGVPVIVVITSSFLEQDAKAIRDDIVNVVGGEKQFKGCCLVNSKEETISGVPIPTSGLMELVEMTGRIIPPNLQRAFINAQNVSLNKKIAAAKKHIPGYVAGAVAIGAIPIPASDAPVLIAEEIAMCVHITATFGLKMDKAAIADIVYTIIGTAGVTIVGKTVVANVLKLIPGAGSIAGGVISGTTAALLTAALGYTYIGVLTMIAKGELTEAELRTKSGKQKIKNLMLSEVKRQKATKEYEMMNAADQFEKEKEAYE